MLTTIFLILHVLAAFVLVTVILFFQQGKGAQIGSSFGGSSQTVFGSRGPAGAMAKVTTAAAVMFMITSITLSILSRSEKTASIITEADAPMTLPVSMPQDKGAAPVAAPVAPEDAAPAELDIPAPVESTPAPVGPVDVAPAAEDAKPEGQ